MKSFKQYIKEPRTLRQRAMDVFATGMVASGAMQVAHDTGTAKAYMDFLNRNFGSPQVQYHHLMTKHIEHDEEGKPFINLDKMSAEDKEHKENLEKILNINQEKKKQ